MMSRLYVKLLIIAGLVLGLLIPLTMIDGLVKERIGFRYKAKNSIAQSWTGKQKLLGPVLVVPYTESFKVKTWDKKLKDYRLVNRSVDKVSYILPAAASINGIIKTEERKRGLYSIPVYRSELAISGRFQTDVLKKIIQASPHKITWKAAYLSVCITDTRGIETQPQLSWSGKKIPFASGSGLSGLNQGMHAMVGSINTDNKVISFGFDMSLRGMENLEFSPSARDMLVDIKADWPHPSFTGRYLPSQRSITESSFDATWKVSSFSSNLEQDITACSEGSCSAFQQNSFGVSLVNPVDVHHKTERSTKYGVLFILLTFVVFFLFEIMKNLRVHPVQYLMVGLSLSVFYLLLLSLSEHIPFSLSYMLATTGCTGVIVGYIAAIFRNRIYALGFGIMLLILYSMLYAILLSEDNALLMGSLLMFTTLSGVMFITRKMDWYNLGAGKEA